MHKFSHESTMFFVDILWKIYTITLFFRDIIEATYKGNPILAMQRGINMVIALFIFSVSFLLTISVNYLFGLEILLIGILIVLNIYVFSIVYIFSIVLNPIYRYYSIYTLLFIRKKKFISSKICVVILVLFIVIISFLYYSEVVQALHNWVLTTSDPLTSSGNNDNPGGNNSGGNNDNPGGNNDNPGGNDNTGNNDNIGKKRKFSEGDDDNPDKKTKYSESVSESESEPEKFYTESVRGFDESDLTNSDEGYDTDGAAKEREVEEMENAFMSQYSVKYTAYPQLPPYVQEDTSQTAIEAGPSQTAVEAGPSSSRPQPSLTSDDPIAPISPSSTPVSPNASTFPNYTTATEVDTETPYNNMESSTTDNLNNEEYTKNNGKGKQQ